MKKPNATLYWVFNLRRDPLSPRADLRLRLIHDNNQDARWSSAWDWWNLNPCWNRPSNKTGAKSRMEKYDALYNYYSIPVARVVWEEVV